MSLSDEIDYEKLTILDRTVDALQRKFGLDSANRTAFVNHPFADHMPGDISKAAELL